MKEKCVKFDWKKTTAIFIAFILGLGLGWYTALGRIEEKVTKTVIETVIQTVTQTVTKTVTETVIWPPPLYDEGVDQLKDMLRKYFEGHDLEVDLQEKLEFVIETDGDKSFLVDKLFEEGVYIAFPEGRINVIQYKQLFDLLGKEEMEKFGNFVFQTIKKGDGVFWLRIISDQLPEITYPVVVGYEGVPRFDSTLYMGYGATVQERPPTRKYEATTSLIIKNALKQEVIKFDLTLEVMSENDCVIRHSDWDFSVTDPLPLWFYRYDEPRIEVFSLPDGGGECPEIDVASAKTIVDWWSAVPIPEMGEMVGAMGTETLKTTMRADGELVD